MRHCVFDGSLSSLAPFPFVILEARFHLNNVSEFRGPPHFRGFLFKGFWQSRLGIIPTILLMSITWTSLHYEYGILSMVMLFIFGICLGIARYKTNSLLTPLLMHAFWNAIALSSTFVFR
jgi:hypothetical protein